jgi:hypothetical protein
LAKDIQGCYVLSTLIYLKVEKYCIYRQSCRLPDLASRGSFFNYEHLSEFKAKIRTARNVVYSKGLMWNRFLQKKPENPTHCHVPLRWWSSSAGTHPFSQKTHVQKLDDGPSIWSLLPILNPSLYPLPPPPLKYSHSCHNSQQKVVKDDRMSYELISKKIIKPLP